MNLKDDLSNYNHNKYEKPSVTVDIAICSIIENDLKVLLIKRKFPPFRNFWAIPGGFIDINKRETLEQTAECELESETNLKQIYIEQLKTYGDPDRDPRMRIITICYFALISYDLLKKQLIEAKDDAKEFNWFSLRNLPKELAFDHKNILNDLLKRLQEKINYTSIAFSLISKQFTWSELQKVYEIILGKNLFPSNFRREILSKYILENLTIKKKTNVGRPSIYLKFKRSLIEEF